MIPPTEATALAAWPKMRQEHREYFEERAGILEHDAGMERSEAEAAALVATRQHFTRGAKR